MDCLKTTLTLMSIALNPNLARELRDAKLQLRSSRATRSVVPVTPRRLDQPLDPLGFEFVLPDDNLYATLGRLFRRVIRHPK